MSVGDYFLALFSRLQRGMNPLEKENEELKQALEELLAVVEYGNALNIARKAVKIRKRFPELKSPTQLREDRRERALEEIP